MKQGRHRPQQGQCAVGSGGEAVECSGFQALGGNPKVGHMEIKIGPRNVLMKGKPKAANYIKKVVPLLSAT